ncbi:MAG: sarcosine oxidase subunit gamma SoxG [Desulfobacterales bacterium]|nr:sarcosine oxidase subunit gamma SoxG [Desulfobacterales bacterium]
MKDLIRQSPISFEAKPTKTSIINGWEVVLTYDGENQKSGPCIIDLSHIPKYDLQDKNLSKIKISGIEIPDKAGESTLQDNMLINRMNNTQASIWCLNGLEPNFSKEVFCTDITDGKAMLALIGKDLQCIFEKITPIDLFSSSNKSPFLIQGQILQVPCQIVVIRQTQDLSSVIFTFTRGFGNSMIEGILDAGKEWGIYPAGMGNFLY